MVTGLERGEALLGGERGEGRGGRKGEREEGEREERAGG
jgi:hypothetical protein